MDEKGKETIAAFDRRLTNNHIQMMKVFLSYLPPEQQDGLAIYIKFSELQYAIQLARQSPKRPIFEGRRTVLSLNSLLDGNLLKNNQEGVLELLDELLPFSNPGERAQIQSVKNLLTSFGRMQEMMAMMDMMKDLFPEGMSGEGGFSDIFSGVAGRSDMAGVSGLGDIASGMGGMDPAAIFQMMQMFQGAQSDSTDETDKV